MTTRIAIVGAGRMGASHARTVACRDDARVAAVVDSDPRRAERLAAACGAASSTRLIPALACDAAIVATPPHVRAEVVEPLLAAGIPVLVEKPFATDVAEAARLLAEARRLGVPVACGFVERFNPAVTTAMRVLEDAGPAIHVVGVRHSPPDPAMTVSVVADLLVHDIDLALRIAGGAWSGAVSGACLRAPLRDVVEAADVTITTTTGAQATLSASRLSQRKIRELRIAAEAALVEADLLRRTVTVWRHVTHEAPADGGYRAQTTMDLPFVHEPGEPLALQLAHFLALARGEADPDAEWETILPPHRVADAVEAFAPPRPARRVAALASRGA